jgi:hypothetical protein
MFLTLCINQIISLSTSVGNFVNMTINVMAKTKTVTISGSINMEESIATI